MRIQQQFNKSLLCKYSTLMIEVIKESMDNRISDRAMEGKLFKINTYTVLFYKGSRI